MTAPAHTPLAAPRRQAPWPRPPVALPHAWLDRPPEGARIAVAGLVLVRQRPGTANGVIFITLEDETGVSNIIVWRQAYERFRRAVVAGRALKVIGRLQRESGVVQIIAEEIEDISPLLDKLADPGAGLIPAGRTGPGARG